ncbi:hypothetical protein NDU88_006242 [Pleurodeles waltl]|uniref:Uncharacterized protein n=1 Tax=Pleurodeles waltl TaxID=8319 RepID=A0AAV7UPF7_PLEWA|nr:hypothetical protein NDU88_006242 [Pleurodeles waltl]
MAFRKTAGGAGRVGPPVLGHLQLGGALLAPSMATGPTEGVSGQAMCLGGAVNSLDVCRHEYRHWDAGAVCATSEPRHHPQDLRHRDGAAGSWSLLVASCKVSSRSQRLRLRLCWEVSMSLPFGIAMVIALAIESSNWGFYGGTVGDRGKESIDERLRFMLLWVDAQQKDHK